MGHENDDVTALIANLPSRDDPIYWSGVVGVNVRIDRKLRRWTQTDLARKITEAGWTLDQRKVSAIEKNGLMHRTTPSHAPYRVRVTVDRLMALARALNTTHEHLLDDDWSTLGEAT